MVKKKNKITKLHITNTVQNTSIYTHFNFCIRHDSKLLSIKNSNNEATEISSMNGYHFIPSSAVTPSLIIPTPQSSWRSVHSAIGRVRSLCYGSSVRGTIACHAQRKGSYGGRRERTYRCQYTGRNIVETWILMSNALNLKFRTVASSGALSCFPSKRLTSVNSLQFRAKQTMQ